MKTNSFANAFIYVLAVSSFILAGCKSESDFDGLKLVAKYKPFNLYIYADTTSTNEFPDMVVRDGDNPIYMRRSEANHIVITHWEKYNEQLESIYDTNGNLTYRALHYYDGRNPKYTYVDTNGDGLFNFFIEGYDKPSVFVRSNMCWVPRGK